MTAYLDHAASTPMRHEAIEAMLPFLRGDHANPSGSHAMARSARRAIDEARDTMAELLGAEPRDIVFTGGGTEADNLAVLGVHDRCGGVVVGSAIEHHAVLDPLVDRGGRLVGVDAHGVVQLDVLAETIEAIHAEGATVSLVSTMLVNNEVGTRQPLGRVAKVVRRLAPEALIHTDAVQAYPWLDVATEARVADLVSISAHKFGGPKGVGVLVARRGAAGRLAPRSLGGGQEQERRSGTQNVAGIVAMAVAAQLTAQHRAATVARVSVMRDRLVDGLSTAIDGLIETGVDGSERSHKVAGIAHVCISGVDSESLLFLLERGDLCASAAASCASGAMQPSHVLEAMGLPRDLALGSLRLSLGHESTDADIDAALAVIPPAVERLRAFA